MSTIRFIPTLNRKSTRRLILRVGLALMVLVISLALTPSLVTAPDLKVSTDKSAYHVGENWVRISWDSSVCAGGHRNPTGTLTIVGPSKRVTVSLSADEYATGFYKPSVGKPWVAADVGTWTVTIDAYAGSCKASTTTNFQVNA